MVDAIKWLYARIYTALFWGIAYMLCIAPCISSLGAVPLCQSYSENLKFWQGNLMQVVSLQAAMSINFTKQSQLTSKDSVIGGGVGVSMGDTYVTTDDDRNLDYGWRIKYLFLDSGFAKEQSHLVGGSLYLHPFPHAHYTFTGAIQTHKDCENRNDGYPTPFSFVIGSGANFTRNSLGSQVGGYIEMGIAFFKWFPINAEVLYSVSFFPANHYFIQEVTHSINIVFTIL